MAMMQPKWRQIHRDTPATRVARGVLLLAQGIVGFGAMVLLVLGARALGDLSATYPVATGGGAAVLLVALIVVLVDALRNGA
jgi:hypothetical protein